MPYNNGESKQFILQTKPMPFSSALAARFPSTSLEKVLEHFTMQLAENPHECEAYHWRGMVYCQLGDAAKALSDLHQALQLSDGYHHYFHYQGSLHHTSRAELYVSMQMNKQALADYEKAVFLDHNNQAAVQGHRALLNGEIVTQHRYERAFERDFDYYSKVKYFSAHHIIPHREAAFYYHDASHAGEQGDYTESLRLLDKAIMLVPNNASLFHDRGWYYQQLGEYAYASANYSSAIACDNTHSNAYYGRGKCAGYLQDMEAALQDYNAAIMLSTTQHDTYHHQASEQHVSRGIMYNETGDDDLAINDYGKALDLNRTHCEAYFKRGQAYLLKENYRNARDDFAALLAIDPYHEAARNALTLIYKTLS
jgi:tetratricopeptide (TPR) repeat protein